MTFVYAYAKEHSIPVKATDWFDEDFIRQMEEENSRATPELINTLEAMSVFRDIFKTGTLLELHAEKTLDNVREIYKVLEDNGLMSSRKRNDRIVKNIKNELDTLKGQRVLIIYGMDHKFFIDDHLKSMDSVELLTVQSWFKPEIAHSFKISENIRRDAIENLKASESTLELRLKEQKIAKDLHERFQKKLPRFQVWMSSIKKL